MVSLAGLQQNLRDQTTVEDLAGVAKVYLEEITRRVGPSQHARIPVTGGSWVFVPDKPKRKRR
jgi:hypothetical protein